MENLDINTLTYTVLGIDEENLVLQVDFDGQGLVNIGLRGVKIPATPEEMDEFLKPFAAHKDTALAMQTPIDVTFIRDMIGQPRATERYGLLPQSGGSVNDLDFSVVPLDDETRKADQEYIRSMIREELAAMGTTNG